MSKIRKECALVIENLAREMDRAERWSGIWDIHCAMIKARRMAESLHKEAQILAQGNTKPCTDLYRVKHMPPGDESWI